MGEFNIKIGGAAAREIRKLPRMTQRKIIECLEDLALDPHPNGVEKLTDNPGYWRLRSGDHRIIYFIDDAQSVVIVLVVRHRKDAYRNLDQLDHRLIAATFAPLITAGAIQT